MTAFALTTENYQGPLEALLALIEDRKMLVSDISLASVCDAYIEYIRSLPAMPVDETAQFVVVAATLLLIKSRSLLPEMEVTDEESHDIAELERRLAAYAHIRAATKVLEKRWGNESLVGMRKSPTRPVIFAPGTLSAAELIQALQKAFSTIPTVAALAQKTIAPIVALEDVIQTVRTRLSAVLRTRFSELTNNSNDPHEVIVYFLAVLELVRGGSAQADQETLFSDITIEAESQFGVPRYV